MLKRLSQRIWEHPLYQGLCQGIWILAILLLPITSLPLLIKLTTASTVAPPSAALFLLLGLVWLPLYLLHGIPHAAETSAPRGGRLPLESGPFVLFASAVLLSWLVAFFNDMPPWRRLTQLSAGPEALLTLALGSFCYLLPAAWLSAYPQHLRRTLLLVNLGGLIIILWSLVQGIFTIFYHSQYPAVMYALQRLISIRSNGLFPERVTGLAYEPSWLAHQLNLLYLPFWISATLHGYSAFRPRLRLGKLILSAESILLALGVVMLVISFSRVGWLAFALMVAYLAISATRWLMTRVQGWVLAHLPVAPRWHGWLRLGLALVMLVGLLAAGMGLGIGLIAIGARFDTRIKHMVEANLLSADNFFELTNELRFAERVVYWETGLKIFAEHPWLGVGSGNAGFYFPQQLPGYAYLLPEILDYLFHMSVAPNIKSFWVRLTAETGLLGLSLFIGWYVLLWHSGRLARGSTLPSRVLGLTGQLVLLAFLFEGFSIDSFAMPYLWFSLGLLSTGAMWGRQGTDGRQGTGGRQGTDEHQSAEAAWNSL
jgi:hypothetical protein